MNRPSGKIEGTAPSRGLQRADGQRALASEPSLDGKSIGPGATAVLAAQRPHRLLFAGESQPRAVASKPVATPRLWLHEAPGYNEPGRMWTSRFELGVRFSVCAAVMCTACDRPTLNDSTSLDDAADRGDAEGSASASVRADERRREGERMEIAAVLHGSTTWFERKRADAELPKVRWAANCRIHRACPAARAMAACKVGEHAQSWEELRGRAKQLSGSVVAVSGQLDLSAEGVLVPVACHLGACCHQFYTSVVLDNRGTAAELENREHALGLAGYECYGDDSKGCCNVIADGRAVIAKGRLVETARGIESHEPLWELREASLCTLPAPS